MNRIYDYLGKNVTVIIPTKGSVSFSLMGKLKGGNGKFWIDGNPSLLFYAQDIFEVDETTSTIRLH